MSKMIPPKPSHVTWNDEQWQAIHESGHDLLISAGAGSGKTAVLVERIIQKIVHQEISVEALLVLTFTNAAAAEMKHRVRSRLEKEVATNYSKALATQLSKISSANISTFHGYCNKLLHRYYYLVGLDPTFKIADDIELSIIEDDVIETLFSKLADDLDEHYLRLSTSLNSDRDEMNLKTLLLKIYRMARANPNMLTWLHELDTLYSWNHADLSSWKHYTMMLEGVNKQLDQVSSCFDEALALAKASEGANEAHGYVTQHQADMKWVHDIKGALMTSYHDVKCIVDQLKLATYASPRGKKKELFDETLLEAAKQKRDEGKKHLDSLKTYFIYKNETHAIHFESSIALIKSLEDVLLQFHEAFDVAKRERQLVDYSDLEWYTMQLLVHEGKPTEIAKEIANALHEIMVDEYQDTNEMQEFIIQAIAKSKEPAIPLFMVGDVKQSIYRFRLAEPSIFQRKYKSYQLPSESGEKIDLMRNYRSHQSVLDSTNFIFKQIMDEAVGEIAYDEAALLRLGVEGEPVDDMVVSEVHMLDKPSFEEDDHSAVELEAIHLAKMIKKYIQTKAQIYDRSLGEYRDVTYRDIVILMRSLSYVSVYQDVFRQFDIPLFAEVTTDLFDSIEIINILSALKVIDNPYQDIPLMGIMRSPLFFFSESELARLKQSRQATYFMDDLKTYATVGEDENLKQKVAHFLATLTSWRQASQLISVSRLIRRIYEETMYYDFVVGLPHGELRKANLDLFYEKARHYEQLTSKKVFGFLTYIEKMQALGKHFPKAKTVTGHDDVVRIMSIHKSKGLEFPIVILAQIHRQFNMQDESGDVLLHKDYGLAMRYIDPKLRLKQQTVAQQVVAKKLRQEMIAEEMRLLYVAMTRAKSKLIFTGVYNATKKLEGFYDVCPKSEWLLPHTLRQNAKAYGDWLIPALMRQKEVVKTLSPDVVPFVLTDESRWLLKIVEDCDETELSEAISSDEVVLGPTDPVLFNESYAHEDLVLVKAKQTVSERKVDETTPLFANVVVQKKEVAYDRPSFMKDSKLTNTEIGTAYHQFMQHFDFLAPVTLGSLQQLLAELVANEILSEVVANTLDLNVILSFTSSPLYELIKRAKRRQTEVPFMMLVPDLVHQKADVLLQGVVDLLVEFDDEVLIVDYKSDYVSDFKKQEEELRHRYHVQMKYYTDAISRIYPHQNVKCAIHYLKANETIYYDIT